MKIEREQEPGRVTRGLVIETTGSSYRVVSEDGTEFRCRTIAATKTENEYSSLVAVGDRVVLKETETGADYFEAVITLIEARRSALTRKRDLRRNRS